MSFATIFLLMLFNYLANIAPGNPNITGSTFIVEGNSVTLTCTSSGGNPVPTVYWYRNNQLVDDTQTTTNGVTTNTYTLVADKSHHFAVFECQVDNNVLQNKLSTTWYFQVYTVPNQPTLNGSQTLLLGTTYQWACISTGGNPSPTMTLRIGNSQFSTGITQTSVLQSDNTYTVTSALSWTPSISNNGQTLYCDVQHPETRGDNLQTVSLQLTVNDIPVVTTPTAAYTVNVGDSVTITCTVTAYPQHTTVYWQYKAGGPSTNVNIGGRFSGSSVGSPSLTISNALLSDQGSYVCYATNSAGTGHSLQVVLAVTGNVPAVTITQPSKGIGGQVITIQCSYVSNPAATNVIWSKGNQGITVDGNKYVGGSLSNPSLTITNVAASDQGSYRCSVVNSVGQGDSSSVILLVDTSTAPSYIRIVPAGVVVQEGHSFTLTCEADGDPTPTYNWYQHDGIKHEGDVLTIPKAIWTEHDGLILCKATNSKGSKETWEDVDVQHIPVSTVTQTNISQTVGSPVRLSCDTRANPSATTWQWFYNGYSLSSTSKVLVVGMNSTSEAGTYTCRAINGVGTSSDITFNIDIISGTVSGPDAAIVVDDTSRLSTGEIVAIILAFLFVLLLCLVVCCCCKGYCASLCGGKKEQVTPQAEPKIVEIPVYYEDPEESVIYLHKLEIPKFYENPEPSVRKTHIKKHGVYSRHSDEYEISKCQVLKLEDIKQVETKERARENTYETSNETRQQFYLPAIEYTYDEEERRRRRRRRRKKSKPDQDEQMRDNKHIVLDRNIIVCKRAPAILAPEESQLISTP